MLLSSYPFARVRFKIRANHLIRRSNLCLLLIRPEFDSHLHSFYGVFGITVAWKRPPRYTPLNRRTMGLPLMTARAGNDRSSVTEPPTGTLPSDRGSVDTVRRPFKEAPLTIVPKAPASPLL